MTESSEWLTSECPFCGRTSARIHRVFLALAPSEVGQALAVQCGECGETWDPVASLRAGAASA